MRLAVIVLCVVAIGCGPSTPRADVPPDPNVVQLANGIGSYKVELLFNTGEVQMYRFYDQGHYHYFAIRKTHVEVLSNKTKEETVITTDFDGNLKSETKRTPFQERLQTVD